MIHTTNSFIRAFVGLKLQLNLFLFSKHVATNPLLPVNFKRTAEKSRFLYLVLKYGAIVLFLLFSNVSYPAAQQGYFWSRQERIPEYYDNTEEPPFLIADQNHTVHAFNSQPLDLGDPDSKKAIFYRQWTIESGWTYPNDILFDAGGNSMDLIGAVDDQTGKVHLVLQLHNQDVYYSQAFLSEAGSSFAWSTPVLLGEKSQQVRSGFERVSSIAADATGNNIVVIYSGSRDGDGLYFVDSSDGGNSWSQPYPIYLTGDETIIVTDPKLDIGDTGIFHAVWSTFLASGSGGPGYYANFDSVLNAWSEPIALDTPGIRTPSVIEYQGDVIVAYHHSNVNGSWWRRSSDGGKTWIFPGQISAQHVGTNGMVSFVTDSSNILHVFFGNRIDGCCHGMWHSIWTGTTWTIPEAVVSGPQIKDVIGGNGFDPRSARAVISNGNVVLVTWGTDGAGGVNGAWYSYKLLNTPELPALPLSAPSAIPQFVILEDLPVATDTGDKESIPNNALENIADSPPISQNPQVPIFLGIIPVVLLLVGIIFVRYYFNTRNR